MDHYRDPSGTESCNVQKPRLQVHIHGQWMLPSLMHSFVGQSSIRELCPPALLLLEGERTEGRKREKFYIYSDVTHTHTRPEPGQPWKAKERKKRTQTTGKGPKQRRGGGTDGPPKPTYTAKRTWPKQSTHLNPHDTLRRGTQKELGTKWGTSWWKTKGTKTISLNTELSS